MTYHGFQPNNKVRDALREAHIYAYPNIWPETSCISVIEAMSAACQVVCPNYAALPETTGNFATMYQWSEDVNFHANVFVNMLNAAIQNHFTDDMQRKMLFQKNWTDNFYNWELRSAEWTGFLQGLLK
jgi:glycosyltransferase involved in cell wall biosynthesis